MIFEFNKIYYLPRMFFAFALCRIKILPVVQLRTVTPSDARTRRRWRSTRFGGILSRCLPEYLFAKSQVLPRQEIIVTRVKMSQQVTPEDETLLIVRRRNESPPVGDRP
jgi:hypothetical protein